MKVAGIYSFKGGKEEVSHRYADLLKEVYAVIRAVKAVHHKTKVSKEKTMPGKMLFSPSSINKAFRHEFEKRGWRGAFREMDFVKEKVGIEVQFGKYAFMVYNVCAKMAIFRNLGHIDCGVEIVPVKAFAEEMSTGVSYFEQFIWDLEKRGVADIDVPVMIIGIDA